MHNNLRNPRNNPDIRRNGSIDFASIANIEAAQIAAMAEIPAREKAIRLKLKLGNEAITSDPELIPLIEAGIDKIERDANKDGEKALTSYYDLNEALFYAESGSDDEPMHW